MKRYIAVLVITFLSCNAMVQNISSQLSQEQVILLNDLNNNQITQQSFEDIKSFYSKIVKQDARSAKSFLSKLMSTLYDAQFESIALHKKIIYWVNNKLSQRTKFPAINEPE